MTTPLATSLATNTLAMPGFLDADTLAKAGLVVMLLIIFAESGLLIGFFLPGDSLLFTYGMLIARGEVDTPIWLACGLIGIAAFAGDQAGYLFGRKVGPALFRRPNSRLFKQENVTKAHEFFERHGPRSIVLARFVPVVRTFTPIVAGVSRMNYRTFVVYNIIGAVLWGIGVTLLGYFLGRIGFIRDNVEAILILIVLISVLPIAFELLRARRNRKKQPLPLQDRHFPSSGGADHLGADDREATQVLSRARLTPEDRPTGGGRHRR
nr:VTT domain-containing protein [Frankia nepalensis]